MKLIRKLTLVLAVLLLSTAFVGAGSAFTYLSNDAVVTPSGALVAGQNVTATMKITVTGDSLDASDKITLTTPLNGAKWSTDIYRGGVAIVNDYESSSISGFMLEGYSDLVLHISLSGEVSEASEGKEISVLRITATGKETNGYSSYSTKAQIVYDKSNFANDVAALNNDAAALEKRVVTYTGYGINTATVSETIKDAKSKISAAQSAGTGNLVTAYSHIEAAETLLTKAERGLDKLGFDAVSSNLVQVRSIATTLYERAWVVDEQYQYLETKILNIEYTYEALSATYNNGGIPDAKKMDNIVADSYALLEKANEYLSLSEAHPNSLTLKSGWNFISVPKALDAENSAASVIFGSVDTDGTAILAYNAESQSWEQLTADTVIKPLNGYWIYSNGTVEIPLTYVSDPMVPAVKQLYAGWNAVGVSAETASIHASSFLAGTPWRVALSWDLSSGNWGNVVVNGGSSVNSAEQLLTLGNGVWLYAETDGTLIGLTA